MSVSAPSEGKRERSTVGHRQTRDAGRIEAEATAPRGSRKTEGMDRCTCADAPSEAIGSARGYDIALRAPTFELRGLRGFLRSSPRMMG